MAKKVIFSGIQPSGSLHIGNYIGAISQWLKLQEGAKLQNNGTLEQWNNELIFCLVDLHAITVRQDPKILKDKILELAALFLACGLDPDKSKIFIQSENPDHTLLAWILDCFIPMGWMKRMTQYKEKEEKQKEKTTVGLFNYPALMAADILLYDTDEVPVGEDQIQHIELTRDVALKFNRLYGETFKLPKAQVIKEKARIMSLQDPTSKMSKSDKDPLGTIDLLDEEREVRHKIKRAVTDSGEEIVFHKDKPAISNLLVIYSEVTGLPIVEIERKYTTGEYTKFKEDLADTVVSFLKPIQKKYSEVRQNGAYLSKVLDGGLKFTRQKSSRKLAKVCQVLGLGR